MRNWPKTLRPASFRGVPFHVEEEALPKTGRRIARHEYVKAEVHATEDMGRLPREFRIRAYIANDGADAQARALIEACSTRGAATLVLPLFGSHQVRCEGCGPSHKKDALGFVAFELDFIEAGQDGAGFPAIPLGDRIAAGALDGLADLVSDALDALPF
ncbi:DNA circularization N-terminal domain-containing protein [Methylobacterium sp. A54F]